MRAQYFRFQNIYQLQVHKVIKYQDREFFQEAQHQFSPTLVILTERISPPVLTIIIFISISLLANPSYYNNSQMGLSKQKRKEETFCRHS